jgi:thiol-disulfide isomerase/thioredoxin
VKLVYETFLVIVLTLLTHCGVAGQSAIKTQSEKDQPATQIDINARFRSLDSTTPISLADYKGKVVVLALWASWCAPCREVMYSLEDIHKEFADRGVEVIALSMEDPEKADADVRRFVAGLHPSYKVGWISSISGDKLSVRKGVLPQILVLRDGAVLKSFTGWHPTMTMIGLRRVLDEALVKKAATSVPNQRFDTI